MGIETEVKVRNGTITIEYCWLCYTAMQLLVGMLISGCLCAVSTAQSVRYAIKLFRCCCKHSPDLCSPPFSAPCSFPAYLDRPQASVDQSFSRTEALAAPRHCRLSWHQQTHAALQPRMVMPMHSARMECLPTSCQTQGKLHLWPKLASSHDSTYLFGLVTSCYICLTLHDPFMCHETGYLMQPKRSFPRVAHTLLCMQPCG